MNKIKGSIFKEALQKANKNHLSIKEISNRCKPSSIYYCRNKLSKLNRTTDMRFTNKVAEMIGEALGLSKKQCNNWIKEMYQKQALQAIKPHNQQDKNDQSIKATQVKLNYNKIKAMPKLAKSSAQNNAGQAKQEHKPKSELFPEANPVPHNNVNTIKPKRSKLAQRIQQMMSNKGISIKSLVKRTYLNRRKIGKFLNGNIQRLNNFTVMRLARGLGMGYQDLIKANQLAKPNQKPLSQQSDKETKSTVDKQNIAIANASESKSKKSLVQDISSMAGQLSYNDQALILTLTHKLILAEQQIDE